MRPLSNRIFFFVSGAFAGGVGMAAFTYFREKKQKSVARPVSVAKDVPNVPTRSSPPGKTEKPSVVTESSAELARQVMKFGHPGPVNDVRYRDAYVVSYNRAQRNANWVAERITKETLKRGDGVDRSNSTFAEDETIPEKFRVHLKDYVRSGYDRGHLAPAADAKFQQNAMNETFLMTNISPQVGKGFNRDYWAQLENFCRGLASQFAEVYVFTGPLYLPRRDPNTNKHFVTYETIGAGINTGSVAVPTHFYKIIMVVNEKGKAEGLGGFVLPNAPIMDDHPLEAFITPIDAIERSTGLEFFQMVEKEKIAPLCGRVSCVALPAKYRQKELEKVAKAKRLPAPNTRDAEDH